MARVWQIVDRPAEFTAIHAALVGHEYIGVVVFGAAGVGKTTLARVVTRSLGTNVRWVAGTKSARDVPLGVFAQLIGETPSRDPVALLAAARHALVTGDDTVVGVDDAHLLDQLSATLLHQIAIAGCAKLIATVRSGETVPDAVTALWKDGYLQRIELQPFSRAECGNLIQSELGGEVEELSVDVLCQSSGGNALYLRHLIEGAVDAGTLTAVNGVWQLRGGAVVTAGLSALLENRLGQVQEDVRRALKLVALCEPLELDVLVQLAGVDAVDAAELSGLIRVVDECGRIEARFSHPLFGEVIRHGMGTASARRLRGDLVRALRDYGAVSAASRIRTARLYLDSDAPPDAKLLTQAAKDAVALEDIPLGERLGRAALAAGGGLAAAAVLSRALFWQGHPADAEAVLAGFDPSSLNELELVQWGVPRFSFRFWTGDVEQASRIVAELDDRVTHPALRLILKAARSGMTVHENRIGDAMGAAQHVLSDSTAPRQAVEWAAFTSGLALPLVGRGSDFLPIAARCQVETNASDGMMKTMVLYCEVVALTYIGELDAADARVAEHAQYSTSGMFLAWALSKIMSGLVAARRGKFPHVIRQLDQALAALEAEQPLPWQLPPRLLLAKAHAALGRSPEAERVVKESEQHAGRFVALHGPQLLSAQSWVAASLGLGRRCIDITQDAASAARESGQYAVEAEALHDAARFGDRHVAERLAELVDLVDGRIVAVQAAHAEALARSDGPGLDVASKEFESLGILLSAADAAAQASSVHDVAGDRRASVESAARSLRLAALCGGLSTPAIKSLVNPLPLTTREQEIATLVAADLTNSEIAGRLYLSVRTVETHIYRACNKLNMTNRDQLAALVRDSPPPDP